MPNFKDDVTNATRKAGDAFNSAYNFIREPITPKQAIKRGSVTVLVLVGLGWGCVEWERASMNARDEQRMRQYCRSLPASDAMFIRRNMPDHPCHNRF